MTDMPNKLPNLHKERTRHGAVCWYVRIGRGQRIRIHGEYGSDAFMADYHAAIAGTLLPSNGGKPEKDSRTLAWLVNQWRQSSNWANTKYETRKQRDNFLGHILKASGHVPFTQITRQHILEGRESYARKLVMG